MSADFDKGYDYCRDHRGLNEDIILIKNELGIKEYRNGDRDKQIALAWDRINHIGDRAEEEDKTLREDVNLIKGELKYIAWFIKGLTLLFIIYIAYFTYKTYVLGI